MKRKTCRPTIHPFMHSCDVKMAIAQPVVVAAGFHVHYHPHQYYACMCIRIWLPRSFPWRAPRARTTAEAEFLALGAGARLWLTEAAAAGTTKMRVKMAQAVQLAKLFDTTGVDWALGHAAVHGRFAEGDLASILDRHATGPRVKQEHRAGEDASLTQGTTGWAALGARQAHEQEEHR